MAAAAAILFPGVPADMPQARQNHMPMNDKLEILQAIGGVNETVVALRSDMSYMREKMDELGRKVDRVEELKASRPELTAAENRMAERLTEYKAQAKLDLDRKIDVNDFNVASFDALLERFEILEKKTEAVEQKTEGWKNKAEAGWMVLCKVGLVCASILGAIAYCISQFIALTKH